MTSLEFAKAFEVEYNETVESQKNQIKQAFDEAIETFKDNISSFLNLYDDDFSLLFSFSVPFICLDCVKEWAYAYFDEMDNVVVESILTGYSYSEETEITKIELELYV